MTAFFCKTLLTLGEKIRYMYREPPDSPNDSGWRFFVAYEGEYDPDDILLLPLEKALEISPEIEPFLDTPCGMYQVNIHTGEWEYFKAFYGENDIQVIQVDKDFDPGDYQNLWGEYLADLAKYKADDSPFDESPDIDNPNIEHYFIYQADELIGFLQLGIEFPSKLEDTDFSIEQLYISPEYRRKGYATSEIKVVFDMHKEFLGCLIVLKCNVPAQRFWRHVFEEAGCQIISTMQGAHSDEEIWVFKKGER